MYKACKEILDRLENDGVRVNHDFKFPARRPFTKRLKDVLETEVDEKYYLTEKTLKTYQRDFGSKGKMLDKEKTSSTLTASMGGGGANVPIIIDGKLDIKGQDQIKRVYNTDGVSPTLSTMQGGNRQPKVLENPVPENGISRTVRASGRGSTDRHSWDIIKLTSKDKIGDNEIYEERYKESREILPILWKSIGEKAFCEWAIRGLWCILSESVLYERVYAKSIFENWCKQPELVKLAHFGKVNKPIAPTEEIVRNMWVNWQDRYPSYRQQLSEQQFRQLKSVVQKLPHQIASFQGFVQGLWETYEGVGVLRQTLSEIQKIWGSDACWEMQRANYRIRKLTPLSCWRLMGFDDADFEKAAKVNSNTQLYKQAGNSIVVDVLEAILEELLCK